MNNKGDFEQFMKLRKEASDEFINGNFDPLDRISAQTSPATMMPSEASLQPRWSTLEFSIPNDEPALPCPVP